MNKQIALNSKMATLVEVLVETDNLSPEIIEKIIPTEINAEAIYWVLKQQNKVHIPDVPVYNYAYPFEGKSSPFATE